MTLRLSSDALVQVNILVAQESYAQAYAVVIADLEQTYGGLSLSPNDQDVVQWLNVAVQVNAIAQAPQQQGSSQPPPAELAYPAKVTLLRDWIKVDGREKKIRAGMRVSAEIKTGSRRVIEYLLSPVMQAVKEAGRER